MLRARHHAVLFTATIASVALLAAGCSGQKASFDGKWNSADEVITSTTESGFDCSFDTSQNLKQVLTEHPVTKEPLHGSLVLCQGFEVLLQDDPTSYAVNLRKDCSKVTEDALASPALSRVIVVGDNYVISGTGPDQAFPTAAQPADLAKAFDGKQQTLMEFYQALCTGIPAAPAASPGPTSAL